MVPPNTQLNFHNLQIVLAEARGKIIEQTVGIGTKKARGGDIHELDNDNFSSRFQESGIMDLTERNMGKRPMTDTKENQNKYHYTKINI